MFKKARPYVLLRAWKWPFDFMNIAFCGFFLGSGEFGGFLLLNLAEGAIQAYIYIYI